MKRDNYEEYIVYLEGIFPKSLTGCCISNTLPKNIFKTHLSDFSQTEKKKLLTCRSALKILDPTSISEKICIMPPVLSIKKRLGTKCN